jgi:acyl carrier protein
MNDLSTRLVSCFQLVFPQLPADQIPSATQDSLAAWDSVAAITLVAVIEEEFRVELDLERLADLTSFSAILAYLQTAAS